MKKMSSCNFLAVLGLLVTAAVSGVMSISCSDDTSDVYGPPLVVVDITVTDETGQVIGGSQDDWCPITSGTGGSGIPATFVFGPVFPNPFNGVAIIPFGLPVAGNVEISIYTFYRSKIETLVNENLPAGAHFVEWDASGFNNGLYYCRMKAGDFECWGKLLVING